MNNIKIIAILPPEKAYTLTKNYYADSKFKDFIITTFKYYVLL